MATRPASPALRYIRNLAAAERARGLADRELLERFSGRHEEVAFAELVRRHGPMVLGLCLRILRNEADAEDAFQATFLVLSRKAAALRPRESLCGWLHRVAYRIAQKARIDAARRRTYEGRAEARQITDPLAQMTLQEADEVLHRELARLPDKFRAPLVLCYLEGLTRDEAAQRLGWPVSTLKSRLEQARERLRARLVSRGLGFSTALLAWLVGEATASAAVPPVLLRSTVQAAMGVAAGGAAAPVLSAKVAALTEGVVRAMFLTKFKPAVGLGLVVACACALALAQGGAGPVQDAPAKSGPGSTGAPGAGGAKAAVRSDAEAVQGAWKVVKRVDDGEEHELPRGAVIRFYFTSDTAYEMMNDVVGGVYSYTLGPKEKPATIDLTSDRNGTIPAIYRLKDDELTLCRPIRGREERPAAFATEAESNLELLVLRRDPKAPKLDVEKVKAALKAEAERRPVVQSLMQIVVAMHACHDDQGSLPPAAICDGKDKPLLSWRVALLPYLDEEELYKAFKLDEPWDSEHNKKLLDKMPAVYGDQGNETVYQVFVGPDTAFPGAKPKQFGDLTDGTGNTILLAVAAQPVPWTKPADLPYLADKPLPKLGGQFKEGFHVAGADGAVYFVPSTFKEKTLRALITIGGGENDTFADLLGGADKKKEEK